MLSQPTEDEGDEFIDGMELVQTDWICENIDTGDDVSVSYRRQFKVNLSKKTSFIFYSFFFLAEDKFSYSIVPSSHSLRVCYIKVWNNKQYHCDGERN